MSINSTTDASSPQSKALLEEASWAFRTGMVRRNLGITKDGYIGAMPPGAQSGDVICVLFNCSLLVVLRKRARKEYLFVGECYLHGFVDGEAITM